MSRIDTRMHDIPSDEPEKGNETYDVTSALESSVVVAKVTSDPMVEKTIFDDGHMEILAAPGADMTATVTKEGVLSYEAIPETGSGADLKITVDADGTVSFTAVPEAVGSGGKQDDSDEPVSEVEVPPGKTIDE